MSGAAIVRALLAEYQPVRDIVADDRSIVAGALPQRTSLPGLSVRTVDQNEIPTLARRRPVKTIRERVQVTALALDYVAMKKLLKAAALGRGVHTGVIMGIRVQSILPAGVGPEIPVGDDRIYEQSRDFMVTFVEAN